jgi:NADH-quinone oxidoreductase subunit K
MNHPDHTVLSLLQLGVGTGIGLVVLGLGGMLLRRSILVVTMSGALATLGASLTLVVLASAKGDAKGIAVALLLLLLAAAWSLAGAAAALTTYRRRGTENLDELRELRG